MATRTLKKAKRPSARYFMIQSLLLGRRISCFIKWFNDSSFFYHSWIDLAGRRFHEIHVNYQQAFLFLIERDELTIMAEIYCSIRHLLVSIMIWVITRLTKRPKIYSFLAASCKSSKVLRIFKSNAIITIIQQKIKSHLFSHMRLSNSKDMSLHVLLLNIFLVLNNFGLMKK